MAFGVLFFFCVSLTVYEGMLLALVLSWNISNKSEEFKCRKEGEVEMEMENMENEKRQLHVRHHGVREKGKKEYETKSRLFVPTPMGPPFAQFLEHHSCHICIHTFHVWNVYVKLQTV